MRVGESDMMGSVRSETDALRTGQTAAASAKAATAPSNNAGSNRSKTKSRKIYLVIFNISKRPNVRSLLCTAAAFGCHGVFVVGQRNFDLNPDGKDVPTPIKEFIRNGNAKTDKEGMFVQHFDKWKIFVEFLRAQQHPRIQMIGVEIHVDAKSIDHYCTNTTEGANNGNDIAFLMGNEGQGLSDKQMEACDGFVRIPQYGNGTASLNVNVAASIILQRMYQDQQEQKEGQ